MQNEHNTVVTRNSALGLPIFATLCEGFSPPPTPWRCGPTRTMASSFLRFVDHTQRRITVGRISMDE